MSDRDVNVGVVSPLGKAAVGLVLVNVLLLIVGAPLHRSTEVGDGFSVGLVFDVGGLGDKSFNDAAYRGLQRTEAELGANVRWVEPGDGASRESLLRQLAASGYDVVVGVGFAFTQDARRVAEDFPGTKVVCIDYAPTAGESMPKNLLGLRFREHEGSFLVGAAAGLTSKSQVVGFVGGMRIPLIKKFEVGFAQGVRHVCPACRIESAYIGSEPSAFANPSRAYELATSQYAGGADVIFHASGVSGKGVFNAARERGKLAIGVDSDQHDEAPCCVLTSMVKRVDVAVFTAAKAAREGAFAGGVVELGLQDDAVDMVLDARNRHHFPAGAASRLETIRAKIAQGQLEVRAR